MIQFCGISHDHLDYMIDDAPAKIGLLHARDLISDIFQSSVLAEAGAPDYLLVFAWSFFDEIRKRNAGYLERGGHMILPLPDVTIYPQIGR